jgi:4-hydroxy-3-methylbut-2-enyl diphosphate reductase
VSVLLLSPLRIEALAVGGARVTGMGPDRAKAVDVGDARAVAVAGLCGAVDGALAAGDVVLATEVRSAEGSCRCRAGAGLAASLRARGLRVHTGPIYSGERIVGPAERDRLRASGVLAVDMESYWLARAANGRPVTVVRVVVDVAGRRLLRPGTLAAGVRALRSLRRTGTVLREPLRL